MIKFFKQFVKSVLRKKGLTISLINNYQESLLPVKYDWLKNLQFDTVLDIGASNGGFATKIREIFPNARIYSFEALEGPFQQLLQNFKDDTLFEAQQLVLGEEKKTVTFYQNEYSGSSSMLKMEKAHIDAYPFTKNVTELNLPVDTLDHVFSKQQLSGKILLKMDVQGAEHLVLKGARELIKKVDLVLTEVSFKPLYESSLLFNDMVALFEKEGFYVLGMENISQSTQDGSFLQADVFFKRK